MITAPMRIHIFTFFHHIAFFRFFDAYQYSVGIGESRNGKTDGWTRRKSVELVCGGINETNH